MTAGRVKGLFLDLDGTLADSMPVMRQVYFDFLARLGRAGSDAEFDAVVGITLLRTVKALKAAHGLEQDPLDLLRLYNRLVDEIYVTHAAPTPGARELLQAARAAGVYAAVVTSAIRPVAQGWLAHNRLEPLVAAVVAAEDVAIGKPDPEPYLKALALAGVAAAEGLAVEDSATGAAAAIGAGIPTWIVGRPGVRPSPSGAAGAVERLDELIGLLG
ncbi:MAG: HAD family hydrolase [Thermodesulfobacteriota bacterium]